MKKYLLLILFIVLSSQICPAQSLFYTQKDSLFVDDPGYIPDKAMVDSLNPRRPLWIPVVESIGLNLALGAFNAYVTQDEFAKINIHTINHNHEIGWTTDADDILTNMWAHPFHGSIYYNLTRSSGYNYWTSLGVATIGSWQWEFFMENEPPALNDWIMTSVAGSMFGEMFYRFSNLILDESLTGSSRFWNELAAGIFNPGRLFNRLIYGRTARRTNLKLYERQPFAGELGFGSNNVARGTDFNDGENSAFLAIDFTYGKLFEKNIHIPFDFFRFNANFNFFNDSLSVINQFRIYGILYGKVSRIKDDGRFLWGIFNHYDYLKNNVYEVGSVSVGPGIGYRTAQKKKVQFIGGLHAAAILMGGANSDYAGEYKVSFLDSARTYNMGPGAMAKAKAFLRFPFGSIFLEYSFWWINTWDGAPGDEYIHMFSPKLRVHIYKRWFIGLEYLLYYNASIYREYPDVYTTNNEQRLFVGYAF
jgi:hypothetical protein